MTSNNRLNNNVVSSVRLTALKAYKRRKINQNTSNAVSIFFSDVVFVSKVKSELCVGIRLLKINLLTVPSFTGDETDGILDKS